MSNLKLTNVSKSYGKTEVLKNINLSINSGEFVVFVGPSGCGKSTLLRMICGLEEITSGDLTIDHCIANHKSPKERGIGMVFQSYALYPHMTVYQNMAFGLQVQGASSEYINQKIEQVASSLKLTEYLDRKPKALSGGQRQRVAIGRALVRNPSIFLFDEPLSNLDAALRVHMRMELAQLHQANKATMIYVTHDQVEAMTLADKIVVLNAGRIEQVGTPLELYNYPKNKFVASFIGSPKMNFLSKSLLVSFDFTRAEWLLEQHDLVSAISVGIRPEHVLINQDSDGIKVFGIVKYQEQLGGETLTYVKINNHEEVITIKSEGQQSYTMEEKVELTIPTGCVHLFDRNDCRVEISLHNKNAA